MAERIFDMCSKAVAAAKSFNPAQVFFAVFPDRCKRSAVRSLHVGKSEASMEARKAGGCVRAGIVDGGRFVVGRVPAEPGAECIAARLLHSVHGFMWPNVTHRIAAAAHDPSGSQF